uniref:Integrator complex subunit 10 n=1 Tax=Culicoides sonorensis TaxID=179676 RepID=A0A336LXP2_CULSO
MESSEEKYLIQRAKAATDPNVAKAIILTAKTLFPQNFKIQFTAYQFEKQAGNYDEAAKSLSHLLVTFQHQQPPELWTEVAKLTAALRMPEDKPMEADEEDFYIKMFQHISYEVQHSILLLTASNSENQMDHCRLILLLLKRFPQTIAIHARRLIETLIQEQTNLIQCREILVLEALPLIMSKPVELPSVMIDRILFVTFEYYMHRMFTHPEEKDEAWRKVFEVMEHYSKILKWEPFLPYTKASKEIFWQRILQIVSSAPPKPSENKQIVYYATILFMMSIQEYVDNVKQKVGNVEQDFLLVEGIREGQEKRRKIDPIEPPQISVTTGCSPETPICLVTAAHCWQLLHSNDILQRDFTQLIVNISSPLTKWINRFLLDLAVYLGRNDEALSLMKDAHMEKSAMEKGVRLLSLTLNQGTLNIQAFENIISILQELPSTSEQGHYLPNNILTHSKRQLLLLPLTKKAVLQYCTKAIVTCLKQKVLSDSNASNLILGNLLVLCQLDWPNEIAVAELIFEIIKKRRAFSYHLFPKYIINIDLIEEFMHLWYPGEVKLEFTIAQPSSRRIGTRGSDKGVKEDFMQIIRQQISRANEDIDEIVIQFLQQEHVKLVQTLFEK